jgi:hypothetical protein
MGFFDDPDTIDPDDGAYQVQVIEAAAFTGKDGREWAKVTLQPFGVDGTFDDFMNLSHPGLRRAAGEQLAVYGVDIDRVNSVDELTAAMAKLQGATAEVTVSHDNGYVRVKVHSSTPAAERQGDQVPVDRSELDSKPAAGSDGDDYPF